MANSPLLTKLTGLVTVSDFGNNFSNNFPSNLPGLQTLFASGHLGTVTLLDGLARFPLTAAQATANADVLDAIASPYFLAQVVSAAEAVTASIPSGPFTSLYVRDSVANVVANLAALEPRAASGELTSIVFTDATPVTMNISAATLAANADALRLAGSYSIALTDPGTPTITLQNWQIPANTSIPNLLNRITTPFSLDIAGPIRANTAAALANAGTSFIAKIAPNSLDIRDHPTSFQQFGNVLPQLLTLANAGKIASIDLRGAPQDVPLTIADAATYAPVLALIVTPFRTAQLITVADLPTPVLASGFDVFTIKDTVANVLGALPQIQALAAANKLSGIFYTDPAPRLTVSAAEIMSGADALGSSQYLDGYPVLLTDPGTPVITLPSYQLTYTMRNVILDGIVGPWSLQIAGRASAGTMAVIAAENNGVLAHLNGGVNVSGFSFEIEPYLDELQFLLNAGKLGSITVIDGGTPTITVTPEQNTELTGVLGLIGSQANIAVECFTIGTGIQTDRGMVPVETLREGDTVRLLDGRDAQIVWIGQRQIDCHRHPNPTAVWPMRIAPDVFGPDQPNRELFLSPDHAILVDDMLVPIKHLEDGVGIKQVPMENVTYYHIELERHEILLADGLAVESYLDTGNRSSFANGGKIVQLHTDFAAWTWEAAGYAPLVVTGPRLEAARTRLRERATATRISQIRSTRRRAQTG